ncbi:MAG: hypothetical protein GY849_15835 [Deltaproteobacteria bacterium]|nr:hypothetical protein [Deltaproteobacteria bacterium]
MTDHILIYGDKAIFNNDFKEVDVKVKRGTLKPRLHKAKLGGERVCVDGDEALINVKCPYSKPKENLKGGTGKLQIIKLADDQKTKNATLGGNQKPLLLKGTIFQTRFWVFTPAKNESTGGEDKTEFYYGTGYFETTNTKWTAE